jgi:predicted nucleic acid-binding protein
MALTHLLETSVLTRLRNPVIQQAILELQEEPDPAGLGRSPISDLEVGFSARNAPEWDRLANVSRRFGLVETTAEHIHRAQEVQRLLAVNHQRGRKVPDLLIAISQKNHPVSPTRDVGIRCGGEAPHSGRQKVGAAVTGLGTAAPWRPHGRRGN